MSTGLPQGKKKASRRGKQVKIELEGEYDALGVEKLSQQITSGAQSTGYQHSDRFSAPQMFSRDTFGKTAPEGGFGRPNRSRPVIAQKETADFGNLSFGSESQPTPQSRTSPKVQRGAPADFSSLAFGSSTQPDVQSSRSPQDFGRNSFGSDVQDDADRRIREPVDLSRGAFGTEAVSESSPISFGQEAQRDAPYQDSGMTRDGFGQQPPSKKEDRMTHFEKIDDADVSRGIFGQESAAAKVETPKSFGGKFSNQFFGRNIAEADDAVDMRESLFGTKTLKTPVIKPRGKSVESSN